MKTNNETVQFLVYYTCTDKGTKPFLRKGRKVLILGNYKDAEAAFDEELLGMNLPFVGSPSYNKMAHTEETATRLRIVKRTIRQRGYEDEVLKESDVFFFY